MGLCNGTASVCPSVRLTVRLSVLTHRDLSRSRRVYVTVRRPSVRLSVCPSVRPSVCPNSPRSLPESTRLCNGTSSVCLSVLTHRDLSRSRQIYVTVRRPSVRPAVFLTHRDLSRSRWVYVTVPRPSVRLSVRPSVCPNSPRSLPESTGLCNGTASVCLSVLTHRDLSRSRRVYVTVPRPSVSPSVCPNSPRSLPESTRLCNGIASVCPSVCLSVCLS